MAMATGGRDMTWDDVSQGISKQGVEEYMQFLKLDVLDKIIEQLNETDTLATAINAGWQGESRDRFLTSFDKTISKTADELSAEFQNLRTKLMELANDYYDQDRKMLDLI